MRWPTVLAASLVLGSCSMMDDKGAAEEHVTEFHHAYDARSFDRMWDDASPKLHQITPKPQFVEFMGSVHDAMGAVKSTSQSSWNVNYDTDGSAVTLVYQTTFANGSATETFIYEPGADGKLMGYQINSDPPAAE